MMAMKLQSFLPTLMTILGGLFLTVIALTDIAGKASTDSAAQSRTDKPYTVAYYYKVKWGYYDEFIQLFKKNHWPVLKAEQQEGKILRVEAYAPQFHGEGRADWHFLTVIVYKNWNAVIDQTGRDERLRRLFPDQEKFRAEEQRRFEILEAHWDVPLNEVPLDR
jgi:hypothetical protein